jgi:hypothetical protein
VGGGEARLLLVVGDAGVGKTRLVTEGMRRLAADGLVSVWGGCVPMRETLPLLPVMDALGELSRVDGGKLSTPRWTSPLDMSGWSLNGCCRSSRLARPSRAGAGRADSVTGCSPRSRSC